MTKRKPRSGYVRNEMRGRRRGNITWPRLSPRAALPAAITALLAGAALAGAAALLLRRMDGWQAPRRSVSPWPAEPPYPRASSRRGDDRPRPRPDSTGTNARPRDDTISQTGPGIPDDTSRPVEISPDEERRIAESIRAM
jgi:hypothetical protein